jgi:outer membrane biosynthesis protein TonB
MATPLRAEVAFTILRDGTVRDIKLIVSSRVYDFDLSARGAIESAGRARAFGPLPAGFEGDALPISFYFEPRGAP